MKNLILLCVFCFLAGCISWKKSDFSSSDQDQYLSSKNGKDLLVPPPLTNSNLSDFYVLPDQNQDAKVSVSPPVN